MAVPNDRKYSESHEWCRLDGEIVTIGITQFAADELTDITYVELPQIGRKLNAGASFGDIESVKATSEVNSPVGGEVVEVNRRLESEPGLVNSDPFGEGWILKLRPSGLAPFEKLMDGPAYDKSIS